MVYPLNTSTEDLARIVNKYVFLVNCLLFFAALGLPQLCGFMAVPAEVKVHILLWVNTSACVMFIIIILHLNKIFILQLDWPMDSYMYASLCTPVFILEQFSIEC